MVSSRVRLAVGSALVAGIAIFVSTAGLMPVDSNESEPSVHDAARVYLGDEYGLNADEADAALIANAQSVETANALLDELGDRVLYPVIDGETGQLTVTVADREAAKVVEIAGAIAVVGEPIKGLDAIAAEAETILETRQIDEFQVSATPTRDGLVVKLPATTTTETLQIVEEDLSVLGVPITIETQPPIELASGSLLFGGDYISRGETTPTSGRCSAGFNMQRKSDGKKFLFTAGHCFEAGDEIWDFEAGQGDPVHIGKVVSSSGSPRTDNDWGRDVAVVELNSTGVASMRGVQVDADEDHDPEVGLDGSRLNITNSNTAATVGMVVCASGGTTGTTCGQVKRLGGPHLVGAVVTTVCSRDGDSGGPLFTLEGDAIGLSSAHIFDLDCSDDGFESYYQPMNTFVAFEPVEIE